MDCQDKIEHGVCPMGLVHKSVLKELRAYERKEKRSIREYEDRIGELQRVADGKSVIIQQLHDELASVEADAFDFLEGLESYRRGEESAERFRQSTMGRKLALGGTHTQKRPSPTLAPKVVFYQLTCPDCRCLMTRGGWDTSFPPDFEGTLTCPKCNMVVHYPDGVSAPAPAREVRVLVPGSRRLTMGA